MKAHGWARGSFLAAIVLISIGAGARADVILNEIMYNPLQGGDFEYIELHNPAPTARDVSGWAFDDGVLFVFPEGAEIPPDGYLLVARSPADLLAAYPELTADIVLGPYEGALDNDGEIISLVDRLGEVVEIVRYDDDSPWEFLADGLGASLERLCLESSAALPENWRAGEVPASEEQFGGSPGAENRQTLCPPEPLARPLVFISEIMYHAILEESLEEQHEFIEIYNGSEESVSLAGWRIAGGVDYTFPEGATIGAGEYRVVAANPQALASVAGYELSVDDLFGGYERRLDNGGEKIALLDSEGQGVESVTYDDDFPWAVGADGFGAGESWLPPDRSNLAAHRHMGISLERVSFDVPGGFFYNWEPSPIDGATPGRANSAARPVPRSAVQRIAVQGIGNGDQLVQADEEVFIQVLFSPTGPPGLVELEYFVDDVSVAGEAIETTPLFDDGLGGGDVFAGDGVYSATLPARVENSIVRYRVVADRGGGTERVSPRPLDPHEWHAYFVSPDIGGTTRAYQLFISPANWTQLWDNIQGGRVSGCQPRASWNAKVAAVFVHEGRVFDAHVRYQGSRWNRTNGPNISSWPYPRPSRPNPIRALSWRISLPRYNQLEGRSVVTLNKITQACPGAYTSSLGYRLFADADVPAPLTQYVRFFINGGYYRYMMQYERPGEEMMQRYHREQAEKYPDLPREEVGHLYKSAGCTCDEGPYGWGDERLLNSYCGHSPEVRYQWTYDRKIHEWADHQDLMRLIEDLHAARRAGIPAMRAYFEENFDVDLLLNYIAIINYQVPFDDMFQNHFLYQRRSDGKWLMTPWDLDRNFGGWQGASSSIYMGEVGDRSNRSGWVNYIKDAFLKSYRTEYEDRLFFLNNTLLHPDRIEAILDEEEAKANPAEAAQARSGSPCGGNFSSTGIRSFVRQRFQIINREIALAEIDAGPDQTVFAGSTVQFDASASEPDPSPETPYTWSNGMEGDQPTAVFDEPGVYEITLTVEVRGLPFTDSVTITVLALPERAYRESGGEVVMEAEGFFSNDPHGEAEVWWETDSVVAGYSGSGYVEAEETSRRTFFRDYASRSPEIRYAIIFETEGTYRVWMRGFSPETRADTCHVNLNAVERNTTFAQQFVVDPDEFLWTGETRREGPQLVDVPAPGLYFLSVWVRESGQIIDKILLTQDQDFTPEGAGPAESEQVPTGGGEAFIRGDADSSGSLEISDAVGVLLYLFQGRSTVSCEDHGDADDNGLLNLTDGVYILNYLFLGGPEPEPPFPEAGFDPTPDAEPCGDPAG